MPPILFLYTDPVYKQTHQLDSATRQSFSQGGGIRQAHHGSLFVSCNLCKTIGNVHFSFAYTHSASGHSSMRCPSDDFEKNKRPKAYANERPSKDLHYELKKIKRALALPTRQLPEKSPFLRFLAKSSKFFL